MVKLTTEASAKILKNLERRNKGLGIRIGVKTTGCSGLAYVLEYVDKPALEDLAFEQAGFTLYVDPKSYQYLQGMTVEYVRKGLNEGFEFINPNERDRCGCRESFRI